MPIHGSHLGLSERHVVANLVVEQLHLRLVLLLLLLRHHFLPLFLLLLLPLPLQGLLEEETEGATIDGFSRSIRQRWHTQERSLPLRSAAGCGRSSAAPGHRDCPAAPTEVVSSVPVGRCARRAPPPPRPWQSSDLLRCGATFLPGSLRRSSAHVEAMSGAVAVAASSRLPSRCQRHPWSTT